MICVGNFAGYETIIRCVQSFRAFTVEHADMVVSAFKVDDMTKNSQLQVATADVTEQAEWQHALGKTPQLPPKAIACFAAAFCPVQADKPVSV